MPTSFIVPQTPKEMLIACVKALKLKNKAENDIMVAIDKWTAIKGAEINKVLTCIIFFEIVSKHPQIMDSDKSNALKTFCLNHVDHMPPNKPQRTQKKGC